MRPVERPPRRRPRTPSARQIVDAILDAAAALLSESGVAGLTTNHVAERAGVSIGSLYRYFPDKESIVAALDLRLRRAAAAQFIAMLGTFEGDFEAACRGALRGFFVSGNSVLRRVLMRDVPVAWVESNAAEVWADAISAAAAALGRIRPELSERARTLRVFVALHSVQGVVAAHVLWPIDEQAGEELIDVLADHARAILLA